MPSSTPSRYQLTCFMLLSLLLGSANTSAQTNALPTAPPDAYYLTGNGLSTLCSVSKAEMSDEEARSYGFSCSGYLMAFLDMSRNTHVITNHAYRTYEPVFCIPDEKLSFAVARTTMIEGLSNGGSFLKRPAPEVLARIFQRAYPCEDADKR